MADTKYKTRYKTFNSIFRSNYKPNVSYNGDSTADIKLQNHFPLGFYKEGDIYRLSNLS